MDFYSYLPQSKVNSPEPASTDSSALDQLLHSKSRILRTKLEVLAFEIQARFAIWDRNLERIGNEREQVDALLSRSTRLVRYHLREPNEVTRLRESDLRLNSQRREEDIQCWRDVVMVMRDFLNSWEIHEQAKSRSIFIQHAGAGTEEYL